MQETILKIAQAIQEALGGSEFLSVLLTSMLPIVEVRGGIPLGLSLGMSIAGSYFSAILAGVIIVPIILLFLKKVIMWMCKTPFFGSFGKALDGYFNDKAEKVQEGAIVAKRRAEIWKYLALYAFVAAPLPLTGFWTGSAIAVFMNLNGWKSFFVIMLGNLTAGGLILIMSLLLGDKSWIIWMIFLIMVPIVLALLVIKLVQKKKATKVADTDVTAVEEIKEEEGKED